MILESIKLVISALSYSDSIVPVQACRLQLRGSFPCMQPVIMTFGPFCLFSGSTSPFLSGFTVGSNFGNFGFLGSTC
jgi:hypothetical protein